MIGKKLSAKRTASGTTKKSKCNNKPFWINPATGETFLAGSPLTTAQKKKLQFWDSILEFKVYGELCKKYGAENVKRQHTIEILPANFLFPALTWNIDFMVETSNLTVFYEVKGRWILADKEALSNFCKLLRIFQRTLPGRFQELRIISDKRWKIGTANIYTIPFAEIKELKDEYYLNVQPR
ncbi:MAG: hypothetical protein RM368_27975 [Nostoc sp. DedSLP03]|uniref:hypothetical protein n=1 Tax=Nostoc sp. DedSLP03 TaxID=3075400 RepID=UPI002AD2AC58|nr:hypothetical protein [Nostoc sp. DedSLP03]MDZ7968746.1 hypothetical protein [Nostoc sp. DedSLP03]